MSNFDNSVLETRIMLNDLGIDTFPLAAHSKAPIAGMEDWPYLPPEELWANQRPSCNIAIRCGGQRNLVVIDCDEKDYPGTFENVKTQFSKNAYDIEEFPVISTASGNGRHIYATFPNQYASSIYKIGEAIGSGEIRFNSGAYVVAPPSIIGDSQYKIINGNFDNIPSIDPAFVFGNIAIADIPRILEDKKDIPRLAYLLFTNKEESRKYQSRSEAEQATITSLINAGYQFEEILELFRQYPYPGKFRELFLENESQARRYLFHSYKSAEKYIDTQVSKGRSIGNIMLDWAFSRPWPGRSGSTDKAVFLALAQIAIRSGKVQFHASCREVAEASGFDKVTIERALNRLCVQGILDHSKPPKRFMADEYSFNPEFLKVSNTLLHIPNTVKECLTYLNHDAFRWGALNKSCFEVICCLLAKPMSARDISEKTGRSYPTIKNALSKMSRIESKVSDEHYWIVYESEGLWRLSESYDLERIALLLGAENKLARQKFQHETDRELWTRFLLKKRKRF